MSRIAGVIGLLKPEESESLLRQLLRPMQREVSEVAISCGHSSNLGLCGAIVSRSLQSTSLVWNEQRDVVCLVSARAFTNETDRQWLRTRGHQLMEGDDIGLVHLYEEHGLRSLRLLNGCFAGVLFDLRRRQGVLFNDRYGLNRIYLHREDGRLYFASEAKSLLAVFPELRELELRGLGEWFSCGCALGNRTLFRGISLLPAASSWVFCGDGTLKRKNYFVPCEWDNQPPLSPEQYDQQLATVFPRVLQTYTNHNKPTAMSLTGGLDGRMIMAWARVKPGELPCYTFNGPYRNSADAQIARNIAVACGQPHQTIAVGDEFLNQFPELAEQTIRISDGAMDVSGAAELYVNRLARQIAPVRLTGNYGSEILRRRVGFKPRAFPAQSLSPDFVKWVTMAGATYSEEANGSRLSFIAFKQVPWHHYGRFAVEQAQVTPRSPFLDNDLVALAFQAPPTSFDSTALLWRLIVKGNPALGRIPTDRGIRYGANRLMNRLSRSREQFLAKAEYAYDYGMPNWLARVDRILSPLRLERAFLGRQKFYHFRTWYRRQLANFVREVLLDPRMLGRPWVNRRRMEDIVASHIKGTANYTVLIHKLLSLELIHKTLLEQGR